MKRLHVHVAVAKLDEAVRFYSTLFDAEPSVLKPDYAKWVLDDPRANFAISTHGEGSGLDHLGIQVEDAEVGARLARAERPVLVQNAATCCYARSDKAWINDPAGIAWETFLTSGESTVYGADSGVVQALAAAGPTPASRACCAAPAGAEAQAAAAPEASGCCG
jgi:catechol 2,3-dioxygenase-like lactoylglutathione lyase family enzyme